MNGDPMNNSIPNHIAIIMDGNGRWAEGNSLPRKSGHKSGVDPAKEIIKACMKKGIPSLTLFIFSAENWSRPIEEVNWIMDLFLNSLNTEIQELHNQGVRLSFIGDMTLLSSEIRSSMNYAKDLTKDNKNMNLILAISYGGRQDIISASKWLVDYALKNSKSDEIDLEDLFISRLMTSNLPDVDLLIRTGGEKRISNFLLWQIAYSEIYFTDILWPSFTVNDLDKAINFYSNRERRFGKISNQLKEIN
tara:strand:+ start:2294 stop:3037 length:744 start_codon:yes stop_codon:yes gene_type:complete